MEAGGEVTFTNPSFESGATTTLGIISGSHVEMTKFKVSKYLGFNNIHNSLSSSHQVQK